MEKVSFIYNKKRFEIEVKLCNSFEKVSGLMFRNKKRAQALLFKFNRPTRLRIHSLFVFFPFIAVWLDDREEVVDLKMIKPFRSSVSQKKYFTKLVEIPFNERYRDIIKLLKLDYA
jgi:uncharacterized membrane protein (UPF0127 family)